MRKSIKIIITASLFVVGAISSVAAPLPLSAIGIGKSITITGNPYPLLGAGGFSLTVDGYETIAWCVDSQNNLSVGDMYIANVILLGNWPGGQNPLVRKGTTTSWTDGLSLTALQRYQASAYLVQQYTNFPAGPDPVNFPDDNRIQTAVWRLTHEKTGKGVFPAANVKYNEAVSFISDPANKKFGWGTWAVISGNVNANGEFTGRGYQTLLVRVNPEVPEPATYGLMGLALCGLAILRRRRASQN